MDDGNKNLLLNSATKKTRVSLHPLSRRFGAWRQENLSKAQLLSRLIPFLQWKYPDHGYLFWPYLAAGYYTLEMIFLEDACAPVIAPKDFVCNMFQPLLLTRARQGWGLYSPPPTHLSFLCDISHSYLRIIAKFSIPSRPSIWHILTKKNLLSLIRRP